MTYLTAALLGLVQGICEFLPISSSGHLALLQHIFHIEGADLMFDVLLHIGTLLPVLWMFRKDVRYVRWGIGGLIGLGHDRGRNTPRARENRRLGIFVLVASVPLLLGLLLNNAAKSLMERPAVVGILLLVNGGILYLAGHSGRAEKPDKAISILDVLLVGLAQIFAVLPGISRSGVTISVGLMRGFSKSFAVKFSFLLLIPAVLGAAIAELYQAVTLGFDVGLLPMYLVGMLVSAVTGYFAIRLLRWITNRGGIGGFAYYCWGAGIVALLLSLVA